MIFPHPDMCLALFQVGCMFNRSHRGRICADEEIAHLGSRGGTEGAVEIKSMRQLLLRVFVALQKIKIEYAERQEV